MPNESSAAVQSSVAVQFSGDVTFTDIDDATRLVIDFLRKRRKESVVLRKILVWGWNLSLLAIMYLIMFPAFLAEVGMQVLANCTLAMVYFIIAHYLLKWVQRRNASTVYHVSGSVNAKGIEYLADEIQIFAPWTNWVGYAESANRVVLVGKHDHLQEFWRKHFASDADWQMLRTLVKEQLPALQAPADGQ